MTSLPLNFAWWFFLNAVYLVFTVSALRTSDGHVGVSTAVGQLGVGSLYALLTWGLGYNLLPILGLGTPTVQKLPKVSRSDAMSMLPIAIISAGLHISTVIALENGSVFFVMVVKTGEPFAAAIVNTVAYGKAPSAAKWLCSLVIVGAIIALVTSAACPECSTVALVAASISNVFAALKGGENQRLMSSVPGIKERIGGIGNLLALNVLLSFVVSLPAVLMEWGHLDALTDPTFLSNTVAAGMSFYLYNELAAATIARTTASTASMANALKRALLIFGVQAWLGHSSTPVAVEGHIGLHRPDDFTESMGETTLVLASALTAILGAFAFSIIDDIVKAVTKPSKRMPGMV